MCTGTRVYRVPPSERALRGKNRDSSAFGRTARSFAPIVVELRERSNLIADRFYHLPISATS